MSRLDTRLATDIMQLRVEHHCLSFRPQQWIHGRIEITTSVTFHLTRSSLKQSSFRLSHPVNAFLALLPCNPEISQLSLLGQRSHQPHLYLTFNGCPNAWRTITTIRKSMDLSWRRIPHCSHATFRLSPNFQHRWLDPRLKPKFVLIRLDQNVPDL